MATVEVHMIQLRELLDGKGTVHEMLGLVEDVAENKKKAPRALLQSEKVCGR